MDNLPKKEDQEEETLPSGEIFSQDQKSAYEEAISPLPATGELEQAFEGQPVSESSGESLPPPPPPFVEDRGKKYLIFGLVFILILLSLFFVFRFLTTRVAKSPAKIKTSLTYWGLWEEESILQPIIDDYQRLHPNITLTYLRQDPKQYRERLIAAIERGEGPDIFRFHNTWFPMIQKYLSPLPKTILSNSEFEKTFYPVAVSDLKLGNDFYGIPLEIDGLLLFYNEEILKGANISVPATWVDIQEAVPKLTVREKERIITSAIALGTAENIEHFSDILSLMMLQNGTLPTKSLFSCSDSTTTTCAVEALSFYRKFAEAPNNTWDETLENSIIAFAGGRVAMIIAPSWQALVIKQINPTLPFKTAPVPQLPCEKPPCPTVNLASYWVEGVSSKSKNNSSAWEFLKYLSQKETLEKRYSQQVKLRTLFGEPYSRVDLGKLLSDNPYLAPLLTSAPTMKSFYAASRTFDGETGLNTSLVNYLKDAVNSLSQGVSPETALKTADNGFQQVFQRFGIATSQ